MRWLWRRIGCIVGRQRKRRAHLNKLATDCNHGTFAVRLQYIPMYTVLYLEFYTLSVDPIHSDDLVSMATVTGPSRIAAEIPHASQPEISASPYVPSTGSNSNDVPVRAAQKDDLYIGQLQDMIENAFRGIVGLLVSDSCQRMQHSQRPRQDRGAGRSGVQSSS